MTTRVFTDFYKHLTTQSTAVSANKKAKTHSYAMPIAVAGAVSGAAATSIHPNKNINMKYAVFVKEKLKPLLTPENDALYRTQAVSRFSDNPITHIKGLKEVINGVKEDIVELKKQVSSTPEGLKKEIEILENEKELISLYQKLNDHSMRMVNLTSEFETKHIKNISKKVFSGILIGSVAGVLVGAVADNFVKPNK